MLMFQVKLASALAVGVVASGVLASSWAINKLAPAGAVVVGRAAADDKAKTDKEKLQGTWQCSSLEGGGGKQEGKGSEADRFKLIFDGDDFVFEGAYGLMDGDAKGAFTLAPEKSPKEIDLVAKEGKMIGIFEWDGDAIKLSLNKLGVDERPTDYTPADSRFIWVFRRESQ